jgi:hypothetical protein
VSNAPVALFVYRRPQHTRRAVEALRANAEAPETDLIVFSDAAREAAASPQVEEVRQFVRTISGFRTVSVIERERNFGLAASIIDGVTRLCREHGRVVVVEDDLVVSRHFLHYMNRALDAYASNERVMQISGYMFPVHVALESDAAFFPLTTSWGWACWQRSWAWFDEQGRGRETLLKDAALKQRFNLNDAYDYFSMLEQQARGAVDSWAIRWYLTVFLRQGLVLYPGRSLVHNTGYDSGRTHGMVPQQWRSEIAEDDFRVEQLPAIVAESPAFSAVVAHIAQTTQAARNTGHLVRIKDKLHGLLAKAKGLA